MKKIKIFSLFACLIMLLTVTGCSKKSITTEEFINKSKNFSYETQDASSQFANYTAIKKATIALSSKGYQVEFYELDTDENAISLFNSNKTRFENVKTSGAIETKYSVGNTSTYSLTSGNKYMYIARVDKTFLYLSVDSSYKSEVKKFVKELGY